MLLLVVCFAAIACCFALALKLRDVRVELLATRNELAATKTLLDRSSERYGKLLRRKAAQIRSLFQSRSSLIKAISEITERGAARELELQAAYRNLEMVLNEPPVYDVWQRSLNHKFDRDYLLEAFEKFRRVDHLAPNPVDAMSIALEAYGKHSLKHLAAEHLSPENETNEEKEMS